MQNRISLTESKECLNLISLICPCLPPMSEDLCQQVLHGHVCGDGFVFVTDPSMAGLTF